MINGRTLSVRVISSGTILTAMYVCWKVSDLLQQCPASIRISQDHIIIRNHMSAPEKILWVDVISAEYDPKRNAFWKLELSSSTVTLCRDAFEEDDWNELSDLIKKYLHDSGMSIFKDHFGKRFTERNR